MPRNALKASWTVYGGIIPGEPIAEFTQRWEYTSEDLEADRLTTEGETPGPHPEKPPTQFEICRNAATARWTYLNDPRRLNWVRVDFLWY